MTADLPLLIYRAAQGYVAVGGVVAAAFLWRGLERVAPHAVGAYAFRPLLVPGLMLLWPLVLVRWRVLLRPASAPPGRHYRRAHRLVWTLLSVALPAALLLALVLRQSGPLERAPIRLAPPPGSVP